MELHMLLIRFLSCHGFHAINPYPYLRHQPETCPIPTLCSRCTRETKASEYLPKQRQTWASKLRNDTISQAPTVEINAELTRSRKLRHGNKCAQGRLLDLLMSFLLLLNRRILELLSQNSGKSRGRSIQT